MEAPEFVVIPASGHFLQRSPYKFIVVDTDDGSMVQLVTTEEAGNNGSPD